MFEPFLNFTFRAAFDLYFYALNIIYENMMSMLTSEQTSNIPLSAIIVQNIQTPIQVHSIRIKLEILYR